MTHAVTQSDFREHLKDYLDQVNEDNEIVYIARSNRRSVAVVDQEQLYWMEKAIKARKESLDYAIANDKMIRSGLLPDDKIVEPNDDYWGQF
ncbi:MAG: type II toxin-antitoxin system prevent-host-death family antitoxin [Lactobacillus equicursoris]|uniref:type II toxin-antitoxin system Phd/YefM family antitoxin n=1 Tax=Lactobacillus equicursoris TaxID=420645 RepID=UPI00242FCBD5|nr:type II toxin-antitoxin system prevent-host-death family antitoxin [Lactobacillus equicursoris]MDD6407863.1 type II toxin-antitoxin system prevent-host-death family antitoxin [Lactobacillus equicursoris]